MGLFRRSPDISVLLVCTANICRSPMAEGVLRDELKWRDLLGKVGVDSAGTHVSMPGQRADLRAQRVCAREGIDLRKVRARQVAETDFGKFSHILAMDSKNFSWLLEHSPVAYRGRISLMGSWRGDERGADIPDPYFGSQSGFDEVLSRLRPCIRGFLDTLVETEQLAGD